jgi:hypothetical protein
MTELEIITQLIGNDLDSAIEKIKTYYFEPTRQYTDKGDKARRIVKILRNVQNDITELSK